MKIAVIGTGYVGLTTGVCLAFIGHEVTCVDIDEPKIRALTRGFIPIHEEHLEALFWEARPRLHFTSDYEEALTEVNVVIFAVGTPPNADGSPQLSYLFDAFDKVLACVREREGQLLLVNKSTAPVGTCDRMKVRIAADEGGAAIHIVSNPEFLRQGRAVSDTLYPERIVAGGAAEATERLREMYRPLIEQSFPAPDFLPRPSSMQGTSFVAVDLRSAEIGKYAANAYLAMKISFINELANLCDRIGADVRHIASIVGSDSRIGASFLQAGIGYGGSCFPKDTRALQYIADANGYDFKLLSAVIEVNRLQKYAVLDKLRLAYPDWRGRKITVLGLSFKPGTDDLRETPSLPIIDALLAGGAMLTVHDPVAMNKARGLLPASVQLAACAEDALWQADAAILITEWPEYLLLDGCKVHQWMTRPLFIDGRNAMPAAFQREVEYWGIGTGGLPQVELSF